MPLKRYTRGPMPEERDELVLSEAKNAAIRALRSRYFSAASNFGRSMTYRILAEEVGLPEHTIYNLVVGRRASVNTANRAILIAWHTERRRKVKTVPSSPSSDVAL